MYVYKTRVYLISKGLNLLFNKLIGAYTLVLLLFYPVHRQPDNGYGEGGGVGATGWEGRSCLLPLATI